MLLYRSWVVALALVACTGAVVSGARFGDRMRGLQDSEDVCNTSHYDQADERAVVCYAGNFLVKMLGELNAGQNKTVEHVRVHLLPYLGGPAVLNALTSDDPDDPNCRACYTDNATAAGLSGLRNSLSSEELQAYDQLEACYVRMTSRVLDRLPQSADGVWLLPSAEYRGHEVTQVLDLFDQLFKEQYFHPNSCLVTAP